jgi:hypothetical protein
VSRLASFMACSIVAISTEDMGLEAEMRLDETDMRLLVTDDCEDRPDITEAEGEMDRGVEMSELDVLYA